MRISTAESNEYFRGKFHGIGLTLPDENSFSDCGVTHPADFCLINLFCEGLRDRMSCLLSNFHDKPYSLFICVGKCPGWVSLLHAKATNSCKIFTRNASGSRNHNSLCVYSSSSGGISLFLICSNSGGGVTLLLFLLWCTYKNKGSDIDVDRCPVRYRRFLPIPT